MEAVLGWLNRNGFSLKIHTGSPQNAGRSEGSLETRWGSPFCSCTGNCGETTSSLVPQVPVLSQDRDLATTPAHERWMFLLPNSMTKWVLHSYPSSGCSLINYSLAWRVWLNLNYLPLFIQSLFNKSGPYYMPDTRLNSTESTEQSSYLHEVYSFGGVVRKKCNKNFLKRK